MPASEKKAMCDVQCTRMLAIRHTQGLRGRCRRYVIVCIRLKGRHDVGDLFLRGIEFLMQLFHCPSNEMFPSDLGYIRRCGHDISIDYAQH
jgi:hypothetical protein